MRHSVHVLSREQPLFGAQWMLRRTFATYKKASLQKVRNYWITSYSKRTFLMRKCDSKWKKAAFFLCSPIILSKMTGAWRHAVYKEDMIYVKEKGRKKAIFLDRQSIRIWRFFLIIIWWSFGERVQWCQLLIMIVF